MLGVSGGGRRLSEGEPAGFPWRPWLRCSPCPPVLREGEQAGLSRAQGPGAAGRGCPRWKGWPGPGWGQGQGAVMQAQSQE